MTGERAVSLTALVETVRGVPMIRPTGHDGSIAAIGLAPSEWCALPERSRHELIASLKAEGFRYVALDITPGPAGI